MRKILIYIIFTISFIYLNTYAQISCSSLLELKSIKDDNVSTIKVMSNNHLLLAVTSADSVYLNNQLASVESSSAAIILELDNYRNVVFYKSFSLSQPQMSDNIKCVDVLKDNSNNYYSLINWTGTLKLSSNDSINAYTGNILIKTDNNGNILWYYYLSNVTGASIAFDNNGNILLLNYSLASFYSPSNINILKIHRQTGQIIKSKIGSHPYKNITANKIIYLNHHLFLAINFSDSIDFSNYKIYGNHATSAIVEMDTNFNLIKYAKISTQSTSTVIINDFVIDNYQNIYITGYYQGTSLFVNDTLQLSRSSFPSIPQMYLLKLKNNLQHQWILQENKNPSNNGAYNVRTGYKLTENTNDLYVLSYFNNSIILGTDTLTGSSLLLIQYDKNGNYIQSEKIAGNFLNGVYTLNYNPYNQKIILSATYNNTTNVCNNALPSKGYADTYITELDKITSIPTSPIFNFNMNVYPNPCSDYITLNTNFHSDHYSIYNIFGTQILQGKLSTDNNNIISTTNLPDGVYLLKFENHPAQTIKFIVQH